MHTFWPTKGHITVYTSPAGKALTALAIVFVVVTETLGKVIPAGGCEKIHRLCSLIVQINIF